MSLSRTRLFRAVFLLAFLAIASSMPAAAQTPTGQFPQTGNVTVHDPTLFKAGSTYYVAATDGTIRSAPTLGGSWTSLGAVPKAPWTVAVSAGGLWAPHVVEVGGTYFMYYAQSNFGTNNSAIGVKFTQTPGVPLSWVDLGRPIITSGVQHPQRATYNAIDPAVHQDDNGDWWIVWGSHFDGIMVQQLEADMVTTTGPIKLLAHRASDRFPVTNPNFNRIEGPVIFKRGGYYYLLTAWDWCCRGNGNDNTYKVVVGRSTKIDGPYVDKNGVLLSKGGGSILLNSRVALPGVTPTGLYRAPGGQDVFRENDDYYLVYHAYRPGTTLAIRGVDWHDGWPYFAESGGGPYDLRDGAYYRLVNQAGSISDPNSLQNPVASDRCLTATREGGAPNVVQATCDSSQAQAWQLDREADGYYRFRSMSGRQSDCLEIADGTGTIGTNVVVAPCRDGDHALQQWYFDDTGHGFHRMVVKQANLALEVANADGVLGTNVVGGYRRDGDHQAGNLTQAAKWPPQQWRLSMVSDQTPPETTATLSGRSGGDGWHTGPVTVTLTAADDISGVAATSVSRDGGRSWLTYEQPVVVADDGRHELLFRSVDRAGNAESSKPVSIRIDQTAPTTAAAVTSGTAGDGGWYKAGAPVRLTLTAGDPAAADGSSAGVVSTGYAVGGGPVQPYGQPVTFGDGTHVVTFFSTDAAANVEVDPANTITVRVDQTAPAVSLLGVTDGATYTLGDAPSPDFAASDATSGVAAADARLTRPGTASGAGQYTFVVTAADGAGNRTVSTALYRVLYRFGGFMSPVSGGGFSAGPDETTPIKFRLLDASGNSVASARATLTVDGRFAGAFSYVDGQYRLNVKLRDIGVTGGSVPLVVALDDGTTRVLTATVR